MVSVVRRMRLLKAIEALRNGLGAAILPPSQSQQQPPSATTPSIVTRIHLTYARKMYEGHMGARKFWRECLPRLKYHNPGVPMTVKQIEEQSTPPYLTVYFDKDVAVSHADGKELKDTTAPAPLENEQYRSLNVRDMQVGDIWSQFVRLTGAQGAKTTQQQPGQEQEKEKDR